MWIAQQFLVAQLQHMYVQLMVQLKGPAPASWRLVSAQLLFTLNDFNDESLLFLSGRPCCLRLGHRRGCDTLSSLNQKEEVEKNYSELSIVIVCL